MSDKNYHQDLSHIRQMMERSSRFISLSGLSGVFAGIYALLGAFYAGSYINSIASRSQAGSYHDRANFSEMVMHLLLVAFLVAVFAVGTAVFLTIKKSKKNHLKIWDKTTKRLLFNFAVPLATGGLVCLIFLFQFHSYAFLVPLSLIFYGLALFNAGNFTYSDIKYLGICEIILGLISFFYLGYGLIFWALGFGVLHIVYGIVMYKKYK